jgi:hypothetical protein
VILTATDSVDPVHVPRSANAVWIERLLWLFMFSFAFDYRASDIRATEAGAGLDQLLFLAVWASATGAIVLLGWRSLLVRPGVWFIGLWGIYVAFMINNAALQGVPVSRFLRMALPLVFCLSGIISAHVAACAGIRPSKIITPILVVSCINIIWRIVHGFLFKEVTLESVRFEVQSPSNDWVAAWIGCAILLRGRFHWSLPIACAVLFIGIFITVTRSLIFPILASGAASFICFALCIHWKQFDWSALVKRLAPVFAAGVCGVILLGLAAVIQPAMIERWNERLFHNTYTRNVADDISYLTRKAEADAIAKIFEENPASIVNGKGIGASYSWDAAYLPEIFLVYPVDTELGMDIWNIGHSTWSYAMFSGGIIALLANISLVIATLVVSIRGAYLNSFAPGPDQWLAFLPFISTCCLLSMSITGNPLNERLAGITFGMMAGLSQAFFIRASWIRNSGHLERFR